MTKKVILKRDGAILVDGVKVGRYQKLTIGGYEIRLNDGKAGMLSSHYYSDIPKMVLANLKSAYGE